MTLGDLVNNVTVQGAISILVFNEEGDETERHILPATDGLQDNVVYDVVGGKFVVSDYEDLEVAYIYPLKEELVIELVSNE
ncbi:MAG: hypothetical protein J6S14_19890 [Clostridia bacterium]|nr:hypothetical protein [Clostridia bacterium]